MGKVMDSRGGDPGGGGGGKKSPPGWWYLGRGVQKNFFHQGVFY